MAISSLASYTALSPNHYNGRAFPITKITVHHMAGNLTVEQCGNVFAPTSRQASSNYGVGTDGRIGCYVDEANAAWTSSNWDNDNRAVTIEVANDNLSTWSSSDAAYKSTVNLVVDICKRNGIKRLNYTGNASGNLTEHRMFAATACPGPWWHERMSQFAADVNNVLAGGAAPSAPAATPAPSSQPAADNIRYAAYVNGTWLDDMIGRRDTGGSSDTFAGILGAPLEYIAIDGVGQYRVKTQDSGWLPWVDKFDKNDFDYGCAGDGSPIIAIEIPSAKVTYAAHNMNGSWNPPMIGNTDTSGSSDTFAGAGVPIDAFYCQWI